MSGMIETIDALYRETTPGKWETRFYTGGGKTIAVPSGFLIPEENCLSSADLCFIVEMRRNWPEIRERLKAALQPEGREPKFLGTFFGFKVYEDPALKEGEFRVQNDAQITNEMLAVEGMEWIEVGTSDVPVEGDHVLTFNDKDRCVWTAYTQDGRWYHANGDGSERYVIQRVTHWMNRPSLPQEGSGNG